MRKNCICCEINTHTACLHREMWNLKKCLVGARYGIVDVERMLDAIYSIFLLILPSDAIPVKNVSMQEVLLEKKVGADRLYQTIKTCIEKMQKKEKNKK